MTFLPRSIRSRLLLSGSVLTGLALLLAALLIQNGIRDLVRRNLNERLDNQIALLLRAVGPDGTVDSKLLHDFGPFTQHRRGWGWRIDTPAKVYGSRDVSELNEISWEGPLGREGHFRGPEEVLKAGRTKQSYIRAFEKRTPAGPLRIIAFAPDRVFTHLLEEALTPILLVFAGLGVALLIATFVQLHIGLAPLGKLQAAVGAIRSGALDRVPADQPVELAPFAQELNALLDENEGALTRARGHVSNLAHGLKTPLATLSIRVAELDSDPSGQLRSLVSQIDGAIRHHLGRARAASPGSLGGPLVSVAAVVEELVLALSRIHAERNVTFTADVSPEIVVKCDAQDFAEMLGNLLDNAWKWASGRILLTAAETGNMTDIVIEDDGPGIDADAIAQAMVPGRRLDERDDGHGFGLPIARELAELHGGSLSMDRSAMSGLRVTLALPR